MKVAFARRPYRNVFHKFVYDFIYEVWHLSTEPVFVNLSRSPGIDSYLGGPVRQPYLSFTGLPGYIGWRNLFLGSVNVYKYGLMVSGSHVVKLVLTYSTVCTPLGVII